MSKFKKSKILKVLIGVWLVITTAYLVINEYNRIGVMVAQSSYNQGYQDSIAQLMSLANKCEPFPATLGEETITLIKVECLQSGEEPVRTDQVAGQ